MSAIHRCFLVLTLAPLLFFSSVSTEAQTLPARTTAGVVTNITTDSTSDLLVWPPIRRNPLQPDPRIIAAFMRPWILSARRLSLMSAASLWGKSTLPKSYKLTPDPLNWSLPSDSPDDDEYAYLPELSRTLHPNTAQRLAAEPLHRAARAVIAKYDVSQIGNREIGQGINFFSIEKEVQLGRELSFEVEQTARLFTDPDINEYVNRTGQLLVQHSDCRVPFVIKIVDDDEVNAFALPGGFFYVNTGLILAADDEAELASVMAHEIAHVCARHATRNLTRGEITQYASLPLIFLGGPVAFAVR